MATLADLHVRVAAPVSVPHPFGLFSVVQPLGPEGHALVGVTWESWNCTVPSLTNDECIVGTPQSDKQFNGCPEWLSYKPFTLYVGIQRNGQSIDVGGEQAERVLRNGAEYGVESQLWGMLAAAVPPAPAVDPVTALASVEDQLGSGYMGRGIIHMSRGTAIRLSEKLVRNGDRMETTTGTPVVVGAGYDGPPAIFATGELAAWNDTPVIYTAWNKAINDELVLAERTYVVGWDCFATGTLVTPAT
jgi:hypothetical protein